jgi:dATP pyrophosphohydrolase
MPRAAFQVLVLPFRRLPTGAVEFACLRRADDRSWQGVAGGGEEGETPEQAAMRETVEELGTPADAAFYRLTSTSSVPVCFFAAARQWPSDLFVIPEHAFAVDCTGLDLHLSDEHDEQRWASFEQARGLMRWDSNRTALWELDARLRTDQLGSRL